MDLAKQLQAVCGSARAFFGPEKSLKAVIDPSSDSRTCLTGSVQSFLLAAQSSPTPTTLLLETLDGQTSALGPGSGASWLAVACGLLVGRIQELLESGVPHHCIREGMLQAVSECCDACLRCTLELPLVAQQYDRQELRAYREQVLGWVPDGDAQGQGADQQHAAAAQGASRTQGGLTSNQGRTQVQQQHAQVGAVTLGSPHSALGMKLLGGPGLGGAAAGCEGPVRCQDDEVFHAGVQEHAVRALQPTVATQQTFYGPGRIQPQTAAHGEQGALPAPVVGERALREPGATAPAPDGAAAWGPRAASSVAAAAPAAGGGSANTDDGEDDEFGWFDEFMAARSAAAPTEGTRSAAHAATAQHVVLEAPASGQRDEQGLDAPPRAELPTGRVFGCLLGDEEPDSSGQSSSCSDTGAGSSSGGDGDAGGGGIVDGAQGATGGAAARGLGGSAAQAGAGQQGRAGGGRNGSGEEGDEEELELELQLEVLEADVGWFFGEGELQAEREARVQRRALQELQQQLLGSLTTERGLQGQGQQGEVGVEEAGRGRGRGLAQRGREARGDSRQAQDQGVRSGAEGEGMLRAGATGLPWGLAGAGSGLVAEGAATVGAAGEPRAPDACECLAGSVGRAAAGAGIDVHGVGRAVDTKGSGSATFLNWHGASAGEPRVAAARVPASDVGPLNGPLAALGPQQLPGAAPVGSRLHPKPRPAVESGRVWCGQLQPPDWELVVCAAALGLQHGRGLEMQLAAAAVLQLLRPMLPPSPHQQQQQHPSAPVAPASGSTQKPALGVDVEALRRAADRLELPRCVLKHELAGRSAEAAACVVRGVCVPLASLSSEQAAMAADFFLHSPLVPASTGIPTPAASPAASLAAAAAAPRAKSCTAVFLHGTLQASPAGQPAAEPSSAGAAGGYTATTTTVLRSARQLEELAAAAGGAPGGAREAALAQRLMDVLLPLGVELLVASGHVPDTLAAHVLDRSGGRLLLLGSVGLRTVRAAAGACGVVPAGSVFFLVPERHVARGVACEVLQGGLGLWDYRAASVRRSGAGKGAQQRQQQGDAGLLLRLRGVSHVEGGVPGSGGGGGGGLGAGGGGGGGGGWVTVTLAARLQAELEMQAAAFQVCFCRLVFVLRSGRVLPGAGAWEVAVARQLTHRADQLEAAVGADTCDSSDSDDADCGMGHGGGLGQRSQVSADAASGPDALTPGTSGALQRDAMGGGLRRQILARAQRQAQRDERLYGHLSYRAVAGVLQDLVAVVLQNGGCSYLQAETAVARCSGLLGEGDVGRMQQLAFWACGAGAGHMGTATGAAADGRYRGVGVPPQGTDSITHSTDGLNEAADELGQRELALGLCMLMGLWGGVEGCAGVPVGAGEAVMGQGGVRLVLDDPGAREAGLRAACRLALLACSVDRVIVNHHT